MEFRTIDIMLSSVEKMNDVDFSKKMAVYAVVSISGGDETRTPTDVNLTWNFPMKFKVDEVELQQNRLNLDFKLVGDDKDVGVLSVSIKELLDSPANGMKFLAYPVRKRNGEPKGQLNLTCKFSEKIAPAASAPPPPPAYWGLKEKFDYGVKLGGGVASSVVKMGGVVASSGVEVVKAVGWEAKKKLEEHAEKRRREELAQKWKDIHNKEVEELRKKREEELAAKKRKEEELAKNYKPPQPNSTQTQTQTQTQNPTQTLYTKLTTSDLYSTTRTGLTTLMTQTGLLTGQPTDMSQTGFSQASSASSQAHARTRPA